MDRGVVVENPYASVNIPRTQLKDGFLKYYLGDDLTPDTVFFNPSTLPTYAVTQEKENGVSQQMAYTGWDSQKIQTHETWARPYNPYASLKMPNGSSSEPFHWKSQEVAMTGGSDGGCCCCCQKCCPCCRKCCCVIS
uniref:cysteine-rich tail protein 1 n=1 Tax=Euleptes europaea TaxID=460621 RepID=UPI00254213F4|nr:cysteine-rich tail protein 1 [Euleptes europaea]